jgi:hypothetical protein
VEKNGVQIKKKATEMDERDIEESALFPIRRF